MWHLAISNSEIKKEPDMQKVALITGATGNLGKAVVREFLNAGYRVVGTVEPGQSVDKTSDVHYLEANLGDERAAGRVVASVVETFGRLDAAIMLVGGFAMGNISNTGGAELDQMFALNFKTAYFTAKPAFEQMKLKGGGRLVFVGAKPALEHAAAKETLAYALSKSLIFNLSSILNEAGRHSGITSSVVVPSIIDTPPNRDSMPDADFTKWVKPEKIAKTILFVCSEEGSALRQGVYKLYGDS